MRSNTRTRCAPRAAFADLGGPDVAFADPGGPDAAVGTDDATASPSTTEVTADGA